MKMRLIFNSGAQADVDVTEFTTAQTPLGGLRLRWTTPDGYEAKLNWANLDELAAIITVQEPQLDGLPADQDAPETGLRATESQDPSSGGKSGAIASDDPQGP